MAQPPELTFLRDTAHGLLAQLVELETPRREAALAVFAGDNCLDSEEILTLVAFDTLCRIATKAQAAGLPDALDELQLELELLRLQRPEWKWSLFARCQELERALEGDACGET